MTAVILFKLLGLLVIWAPVAWLAYWVGFWRGCVRRFVCSRCKGGKQNG